jgi:hypothetical protein
MQFIILMALWCDSGEGNFQVLPTVMLGPKDSQRGVKAGREKSQKFHQIYMIIDGG